MSQRRFLLLVDDWERLERLESKINQLLPSVGIECCAFGSEALERLREDAASFLGVYVELEFESMTTGEFLAQARAIAPQIRVFAPSSSAMTVDDAAAEFIGRVQQN